MRAWIIQEILTFLYKEIIYAIAKELNTDISVAVAHEYCNVNVPAPTPGEISEIVKKLIEMKNKGYSLVNSVSYFRVMAKEKIFTTNLVYT